MPTNSRNEDAAMFDPDQCATRAGNAGLQPDRRATAPMVVLIEFDDQLPEPWQCRTVSGIQHAQLADQIRIRRELSQVNIVAKIFVEQIRHEHAVIQCNPLPIPTH